MLDLNLQLHLIHLRDSSHFDFHIWLKVTAIVLVAHKVPHLILEKLDILKSSVEIDVDEQLFAHGFGTRYVINPEAVENHIWDLGKFVRIRLTKHTVKEGNVLYHKLFGTNIHSIKHVKGMLDEEEDTGTKYFLCSATEYERERQECGTCGCKGSSEGAVEKGNCSL